VPRRPVHGARRGVRRYAALRPSVGVVKRLTTRMHARCYPSPH
jgi:hypothetical protein